MSTAHVTVVILVFLFVFAITAVVSVILFWFGHCEAAYLTLAGSFGCKAIIESVEDL